MFSFFSFIVGSQAYVLSKGNSNSSESATRQDRQGRNATLPFHHPDQANPIARRDDGIAIIAAQPHYRSLIPPSEQHHQRPVPRRPRIAEEDECPVCHRELPSRTLSNFETLRESHIGDCIASAMRSTTPQAPGPIASSARPNVQASASSSAAPTAPVPSTPEARMAAREEAHAAIVLGASRQQASPTRRSGVVQYKATEKDCIDDAECTICMEEYEVGVDMGRLECFCRFHLHCIRGWFVEHPGMCPVHQHDGGIF